MSVSISSYHPEHGLACYEGLEGLQLVPEGSSVWVDIETKDNEVLHQLAGHFGLHELTIEDCLSPGHLPKLEDFGSHVFMILRGVKPQLTYAQAAGDEPLDRDEQEELGDDEEGKRLTYKVAMYLGANYLVTVHRQSLSWLDALVRQAGSVGESYMKKSMEVLAHKIIDVMTDRSLRSLGLFDRVLDALEEVTMERPHELEMRSLLELKRRLSALRLMMREQRTVISQLANDTEFIRERHQRRYFKDIDDHAVAILHVIDKQIDEVGSLREAHLAQINLRLGDIMRILAVIAAITAPLNVVVGLYGMNFDAIPLLHSPLGFWIVVTVMGILTLLMLLYFKKKHWL
jgi:magnesium transporter